MQAPGLCANNGTAAQGPSLLERWRCANCGGKRDGCGHLWTHKNGNSPNAAVQQIDFIFATDVLADQLLDLWGGVGDFEDAWDVSDHAPVVAEFE